MCERGARMADPRAGGPPPDGCPAGGADEVQNARAAFQAHCVRNVFGFVSCDSAATIVRLNLPEVSFELRFQREASPSRSTPSKTWRPRGSMPKPFTSLRVAMKTMEWARGTQG